MAETGFLFNMRHMASNQHSIPKFDDEELDLIRRAQKASRNKGALGSFMAECVLKYSEALLGEPSRKKILEAVGDLERRIDSCEDSLDSEISSAVNTLENKIDSIGD